MVGGRGGLPRPFCLLWSRPPRLHFLGHSKREIHAPARAIQRLVFIGNTCEKSCSILCSHLSACLYAQTVEYFNLKLSVICSFGWEIIHGHRFVKLPVGHVICRRISLHNLMVREFHIKIGLTCRFGLEIDCDSIVAITFIHARM